MATASFQRSCAQGFLPLEQVTLRDTGGLMITSSLIAGSKWWKAEMSVQEDTAE